MRKLRAIWNIITSDKFVVFTYRNAPQDNNITYPDYFDWVASDKELYFVKLINNIIKTWKDESKN